MMMKTLSGAIESLVRRGFTEHFGVRGDLLRGFESGKTFRADEITIREYDRFEGVSDPDDMAILYAIESSGGTRGTLVDAFGVYSNPAISAYFATRSTSATASGRGEGRLTAAEADGPTPTSTWGI